MVLTGTEVKAARDGKVQLKDSYAEIFGNEAWLVNAHISPYSHGNRENHAGGAEPQAAAAPPGDRQAVGQDAGEGPHADPHEGVPEGRPHQVRNGPRARQETARQARGRAHPQPEAEARAAIRRHKARE